MNRTLRILLPLAVLALLAALLFKGMQYDPKNLPSARAGKPAPAITLPLLGAEGSFRSEQLRGRVWILNVFASWCTACIAEHPQLLKLAQRQGVLLIGLAYKDAPADTDAWLRRHGNPYRQVALDTSGRTGIDYGVYGVPETYVIDADGIIVLRHVGPIEDDFFEQNIAPLLRTARASAARTAP